MVFSIGSNDLTQLTLGPRFGISSYLFSEENPAVKALIKETIRGCYEIKVGLCG
jgi:pyruvate,water dikinase